MKKIRSVLAVGLVVLLAGCATTFKPWKLSEVQEGMTRDEVVAVLGQPDYTVNKDGAEYLYYSYYEEPRGAGHSDMAIEQDIERKAENLSRTLDETKYEVVIVDGRMINYKEMGR